ncbi:S8 family peptidase [Mesorhizobium sp. NZP2298]|uniref:S8 family peptidase n=1 Tax=Mesorhizobium sp. NZP2298 TaxID=2483403 RepID=UPI001555B435|nr:S8 family peptidase [Mesorhizobium sp. NZP2298]
MDAYLAEQAIEKVPLASRGMPVTVTARPNVSLDVGAARSNTRGLKLLNIRRAQSAVRPDGNDNADQATLFVTRNMLASLRKNLDRYAEWEDTFQDAKEPVAYNEDDGDVEGEERRPRNFWLFETSAAIRPTTLRDLWTDAVERFPRSVGKTKWEVWTRKGFQDSFARAVERFGILSVGRPTEFVETVVRNVVASPEELQRIVQSSAAVVELRSASSFVSDFFDMIPEQRARVIDQIAARISGPLPNSPRTTILDTGVNRAHPLLSRSLPSARCYTVDPNWGTADQKGHGTKMAGLAQFGDLAAIGSSSAPIILSTELESVVVAAPQSPGDVPARDAIKRAVDLVEKDRALRIFCLAQTAEGEAEDGRPTSTSAVLDQLAYGDGSETRLFCAAVGNAPRTPTEPYQVADYEDRNARFGIQSPAQALNALSVGAVSLKGDDQEVTYLLAPIGDLMPTSRTATSWAKPHAAKPDIVMEGGNLEMDALGLYAQPSASHFVMTTSRDAPERPLALSGETSTATALAAGLATRLLARYPDYRMETIRALMVHSAEWTPAMRAQARRLITAGMPSGEAWRIILDRFGWGVPNQERLFFTASNALTLIAEDELLPYERAMKDGRPAGIRLRQMKYFKLPWPRETLRSLSNTQVEMRSTLSYFIEPDPHAASRDRVVERYPSHRLKFDVKRFGESDAQAQHRYNLLVPEDGSISAGSDEGWLLSGLSQRGTIVQDIWQGPAYRLADRDGISVAPVRGWWGDMSNLENYERSVRFSLVVSVRTPEQSGDLVAEISNKIPAGVLVERAVATIPT